MAIEYFIKDKKCYKKEGNSTSQVGKVNAVHVSQGIYDGKDSYAITYSDGRVYMTTGPGTIEVNHGSHLGDRVVETTFKDGGIVVIWNNGKKYIRTKAYGKQI